MSKSQRELAFLRDLYIQDDWTRRFTDLVDKHMDLRDSENMLYINAGTGGHALAIHERFGEKTDVFASCEDEDLARIAREKGAAIKSPVDFSTIRFEDDSFDAVLADGSFVRPSAVEDFIGNAVRVARTGGDVAVFLPSAGSFGEVFSLLWEALLDDETGEHDHLVEDLISEIPTVSRIEDIASDAGLVNINSQTAQEVFEFDDAAAFASSPLVADFLMPVWLETLSSDQRAQANTKLIQLIDDEDGSLTFRFSVKATLVTGEKG